MDRKSLVEKRGVEFPSEPPTEKRHRHAEHSRYEMPILYKATLYRSKSSFLVTCAESVPAILLCALVQRLTAHVPAAEATIPPDINIGRAPRVHLKIIPLIPPAVMLLRVSCLPL